MPRILAIDYGRKRTGLAVTDPFQIIASSLETIHSKDLITFIKKYHESEVLESIVIGYPLNLQNEPTDATKDVEIAIKQLKKAFPLIPIHLIDERFTSKMAFQTILDAGKSKKYRRDKANIDKVSATIILQSFLETKKT